MREWTGIELHVARDMLEGGAPALLGRILFEFSRLDMALGLFLVWTNDGRDLNELSEKIEEESFALRLNRLEKHVGKGSLEGSKKRTAYAVWIAAAREIRIKRNELVHGRWGTDPMNGRVINVTEMGALSLNNATTGSPVKRDGK